MEIYFITLLRESRCITIVYFNQFMDSWYVDDTDKLILTRKGGVVNFNLIEWKDFCRFSQKILYLKCNIFVMIKPF